MWAVGPVSREGPAPPPWRAPNPCCFATKKKQQLIPFANGIPFRKTTSVRYIQRAPYTRIMKGYNRCSWLKSGETEVCGKSCLWEYCKIHRAKIRKGCKVPVPCGSCGRGVQSDIPLCRDCGREKIRHWHKAQERAARIVFGSVLEQLMLNEHPFRDMHCLGYTHPRSNSLWFGSRTAYG